MSSYPYYRRDLEVFYEMFIRTKSCLTSMVTLVGTSPFGILFLHIFTALIQFTIFITILTLDKTVNYCYIIYIIHI